MEPLDVVAELWKRIDARDWDGVARLLAEDLVVDWPVSGERIVGRANFLAVADEDTYGEDGSVRLLDIVADGERVISEVELRLDHVVYRAVSWWTVRDGRVVAAREYWTSPGQDPAPRWRAGYVERVEFAPAASAAPAEALELTR
ncbi:nuclear transport factor 2 family protein [Streptomyces sp. BI20]|uniref:nuclear transport factor 2 family protein n=1 Tax=Streptomyces sp. BI20 TaxID=3403460 RepID=UPI003C791FFD